MQVENAGVSTRYCARLREREREREGREGESGQSYHDDRSAGWQQGGEARRLFDVGGDEK